MFKLTVTRALVLGALAANASVALADPTYHIIVTKVGFPTASANNGGSAGAGAGGSGTNSGSGTSGSGSSSSGGTTTPTLADCTLPWGGKLASGSSVAAYTAPSVISPANCSNVAVTETCTDGVLSAPTAVQSCAVLKPCTLPWGETLLSNVSVPAYSTSAVSYPASCDSAAITESCSDGTLSAPSATKSCEVVPTVALNAVALPAAQAGVAYSYDLNQALAVGDSAFSASNVTWSVVGSLPAGLSLSASGILSGTPGVAAAGTDSVTVQVHYKGQTTQSTYPLNVAPAGCALPWGGALGNGQSVTAYTSSSVTSPAACSSVAVTETCSNGTLSAPTAVQNCTVAMRNCTLPWGASLASGASSAAYTTSAVTYPTSCSSVAESDTCTDGTLSDPSASQGCQVVPTLVLSSAVLPQAIASASYSYDLNQNLAVGDNSYSANNVLWSVVAGSLPQGLTLTSDGHISGTPTAGSSGTVNATVRATYKGVTGEQVYQLVTLNVQVSLAATAPPTATATNSYSYDMHSLLTVTGDAAYSGSNVSWALTSGALPSGLLLDQSTGVISGTPTTTGTANIGIKATYRNIAASQSYAFVVQQPSSSIQYLAVAGGGGGGTGGGGAGGVLQGFMTVTAGNSYTVTVGGGGALTYSGGFLNVNGNGGNSVVGPYTAIGGGAGGTIYTANGGGPVSLNGTTYKGAIGGSGGGSGGNNAVGYTTVAGGAGTTGQGYAGGSCSGVGNSPGGGGGGAGGAGVNATSSAGAGGVGVQSSITGGARYYGGGGGAGSYAVSVGAGGTGGGGAGSTGSATATAGTDGLGGGGGGNAGTGKAARGGNGVVILSVPIAFTTPSFTCSPTVQTVGANHVYTFSTVGSCTVTF